MQRKNYLLKNNQKKGMAMIMAISVIVVLSTIMALSLSLTAQTGKRTTDIYLYEQAVLLSQSAAEYALLRISQSTPCKHGGFSFTHDNIYDINITMKYIFTSATTCSPADANGTDYFNVVENDTNGTVLMDITVTTNAGTEPIRYFRRSIQKL